MTEQPLYKIGIVFGVFDGLHEGHRYFLDSASRQCEALIVVVALSEVVEMLKKHSPRFSYKERVSALETFNPNLKIIPSDRVPGTWSVLEKYSPEMIFIGYDQTALASALETIQTPYTVLAAHYPKKFKSSIIHGETTKE